MAMVLHHSRAKGTAKLVLLGIANHQGDGGAWPSVATLARYANVHERNVQRAIDQLVAKGELVVQLQDGGGHATPDHRRPNRYDVLVSCPPWCDRSAQHRDTRGQSALWTTGVANSPPGGARARGRVAIAPPHPVAIAPPEPSLRTPAQQVVPQPQDARACAECGVDQARCQAQQRAWPAEDRHDYTPVRAS
jgi:hypothetical protein